MDRLSDLPDGVICHILSFIPTQNSVQTSILAKRWRFMWAHVPVLDFNYCDYDTSKRSRIPLSTVMLSHKVESLITFRLTYPITVADVASYAHASCIATAVERNVQNLYLALRVHVPRCLLTCKTLVDLIMCDGVIIPSSGHIYLPNLKKLHLRYLDCDVDFTCLLLGCPVLEEFIIDLTMCSDPRGCCISSPTLKRLTIMYLLDRSMFDNPVYMVTINTPALRYLKVHDCSNEHISILLCASLVEADICISSLGAFDDFYHHCLLKLLDSVRNVKCLKFKGYCDKICGWRVPVSIVKFENLTKLEMCASWCLLPKFLESADHLQVLTIFDHRHSEHWIDPIEERRCACLLHSLRSVSIDCFGCTEGSFNMVGYILRNAQVLERMEIHCFGADSDFKEKFDAICRISRFCRESKKCVLDFS